MKRGYTKSWRKELESEVWNKNPIYQRVFFYLRQKAKWEFEEFPTERLFKINLLPGQLITSLDIIAEGVSWFENKRQTRPARKTILKILNWLEINGMITRHSNNEGTFISICNWSLYQTKDFEHGNRPGNTVETALETGTETQLKKEEEVLKETKDSTNAESKKPIPPPTKILPYPERVEKYWNSGDIEQNKSIWQEAYPGIDIEGEIKKAKAWLLSNPKKAKSDFRRFINNWLIKAKPGEPASNGKSKSWQQKKVEERKAYLINLFKEDTE